MRKKQIKRKFRPMIKTLNNESKGIVCNTREFLAMHKLKSPCFTHISIIRIIQVDMHAVRLQNRRSMDFQHALDR